MYPKAWARVMKAVGKGGATELARLLTVRRRSQFSAQRVWSWGTDVGKIPAEFCPDIEALTGVPCEVQRPDVAWSVLRQRAA